MNLKPLVNDLPLYKAFLEKLDQKVGQYQKVLEQSTNLEEIYRAQGAIQSLRMLKRLREEVNNG